jgi:hypothetical protein
LHNGDVALKNYLKKEHVISRPYNFRRQKRDQERSEEDFKIQIPYNINAVYMKCKNKTDTSNNGANCNHLRIIQTILE